jgi:hypothetical protein
MALTAGSLTKPGYYDSGKVHTGTRMRCGMNTGFAFVYWGNGHLLANMIKQSIITSNTASPGTVDANGYIDASSGGGYTLFVVSGFVEAGTYVLSWDDLTADVVLSGTGVGAPIDNTTGRRVYTIATDSDPMATTDSLFVTVTGGYCQSIELCLAEDEALLAAGNIVSTQFKADLAGNSVIRVMPSQNMFGGSTDYATEHYDINALSYTQGGNNVMDLSAQAYAKIAEELGMDLWFCIQHQWTDQSITDFCTELNTYLVNQNCYLEFSNEIWNTASPFSESTNWVDALDAPTIEGVCTPSTATVNAVGHGLSDGASLYAFNSKFATSTSYWPFTTGGVVFAMNVDANNFKVMSTLDRVTGITKGAVTTIDHSVIEENFAGGIQDGGTIYIRNVLGMTEINGGPYIVTIVSGTQLTIPVDSTSFGDFVTSPNSLLMSDASSGLAGPAMSTNQTYMRVKDRGQSFKSMGTNLAERSIEMWDLAEAQLGSKLKKVGAGFIFGWITGQLADMLAVPRYRESLDYFATGGYYYFRGIAADWWNYTNTQLSDWTINNFADWTGDGGYSQTNHLDGHAALLKGIPLIVYEGGSHNSQTYDAGTLQSDKIISWEIDVVEAARATTWVINYNADKDVKLFMNFCSHLQPSGSHQMFGYQRYSGESPAPKHDAMATILAAGGGSKT